MQNLKQAMRSFDGVSLGLREAGMERAGWGFGGGILGCVLMEDDGEL